MKTIEQQMPTSDQVHPIVIALASQIFAEGDPALDPVIVEELRVALLSFAGSDELRKACTDLFAFAVALDREHQELAIASELVNVLNDEELIAAMQALPPPALSATEAVTSHADQFAQFKDENHKVAPKVGARAPKGSVKVDSLNRHRRV